MWVHEDLSTAVILGIGSESGPNANPFSVILKFVYACCSFVTYSSCFLFCLPTLIERTFRAGYFGGHSGQRGNRALLGSPGLDPPCYSRLCSERLPGPASCDWEP
jgi:hypothetical protein